MPSTRLGAQDSDVQFPRNQEASSVFTTDVVTPIPRCLGSRAPTQLPRMFDACRFFAHWFEADVFPPTEIILPPLTFQIIHGRESSTIEAPASLADAWNRTDRACRPSLLMFGAAQHLAHSDDSRHIEPMERQLELTFHEATVSEEVAAPRIRDAVNELLNSPSTYASRKRVSLVYEGSLQDRPRIGGPQDAKAFFAKYWLENPGHDQERFVVACLDTKNRVQSVVLITIGTLDASLVHPREVFKPAILEGSSSIILSHNHPSGDPTPSREDQKVTERLTEAGKLLGIEVLDHIIHGDGSNNVQSLREAID